MKRNSLITMILGLSLLLGGCIEEKQVDSETVTGDTRKNDYEKENFVPIQEYTGEGFKLRDSREENLEIAEKYREEVEKAVKQFFLDEYKTEVKVHNMVAAVDGVKVHVESIGEPHFYIHTIVPVDINNKTVRTDSIWALEGQIEKAIQGGLYAMAYEEEFKKLDNYLEGLTKEHPITGTPIEANQNVLGTGYMTSYYFIAPAGDVFKDLFNLYLENPKITTEEIREFLANNQFESHLLNIAIEFYMEQSNTNPKQEILDAIASDIESMENIPRGEYTIILNDNFIDKSRGIGLKENSLRRSSPNDIIKE